jgi:hypothetical protein
VVKLVFDILRVWIGELPKQEGKLEIKEPEKSKEVIEDPL